MNRLLSFIVLTVLAVAPSAAQSQPATKVAAGPHGYDWLIGTWNCTNNTPSALSGPPTSSYTASRSIGGSIVIHSSGKSFDSTGYLTYDPKSKTWWAPAAFADGSSEVESSKDVGNKVTFAGTYMSGGKPTTVRDMYTLLSANKQSDVGQMQTGGTWKTTYAVICTRA